MTSLIFIDFLMHKHFNFTEISDLLALSRPCWSLNNIPKFIKKCYNYRMYYIPKNLYSLKIFEIFWMLPWKNNLSVRV